jgi:hypothetical protein
LLAIEFGILGGFVALGGLVGLGGRVYGFLVVRIWQLGSHVFLHNVFAFDHLQIAVEHIAELSLHEL